jgi:hypothetical protein
VIKPLKEIINYLAQKPRTLFFIDSLGALLTTLFLFAVLRNYNEYFGIPKTILTYLAAIALCLCIYSTICYFFLKGNWKPFAIGISIANLLYCILSIVVIIFYYPLLTTIGKTYILVEIIIICTLVYIEVNVVLESRKRQQTTT